MSLLGVKNRERYSFISYQEAPKKLASLDLRETMVILDEIHHISEFFSENIDALASDSYSY